jgi:hypothetical protein
MGASAEVGPSSGVFADEHDASVASITRTATTSRPAGRSTLRRDASTRSGRDPIVSIRASWLVRPRHTPMWSRHRGPSAIAGPARPTVSGATPPPHMDDDAPKRRHSVDTNGGHQHPGPRHRLAPPRGRLGGLVAVARDGSVLITREQASRLHPVADDGWQPPPRGA